MSYSTIKSVAVGLAVALMSACASTPCAHFSAAQILCAAPLPQQPVFIERNEQIVARSAQGEQWGMSVLEWQPEQLHIAATTLIGQRLYDLRFDGEHIIWQPGLLPFALPPENVLVDVQLIWWPLSSLKKQLQLPWSIMESVESGERLRELHYQNTVMARISYTLTPHGEAVHFQQLALHYDITLTPLAVD